MNVNLTVTVSELVEIVSALNIARDDLRRTAYLISDQKLISDLQNHEAKIEGLTKKLLIAMSGKGCA